MKHEISGVHLHKLCQRERKTGAQTKVTREECAKAAAVMDKWLKRPDARDSGEDKKKEAKSKPRRYSEDYILHGFPSTSGDPPQTQCFIYREILATSPMRPAHLQRHQSTKHSGSPQLSQAKHQRFFTAYPCLLLNQKKPHSIVEEPLLPAATAVAEIMMDKKAADTLKKVPLSNNTVSRRINMSLNITGQFALQLDEMTDVRGDAQLLGFVRFKDVSDINEHVLLLHDLVSPDLSAVMDDALHTDVRWLSRGKTLLRRYEVCIEVFVFLKEHLHPLAVVSVDAKWVARLAYLTDMFVKLNEINLYLQGRASHVLKIKVFTKKSNLWDRKSDEGDVSCSLLLDARLTTADVSRGPVVRLVQAHLSSLSTDSSQYFQDIEESERLDWVRDPFIVSESSNSLLARLHRAPVANLLILVFSSKCQTSCAVLGYKHNPHLWTLGPHTTLMESVSDGLS
uniref:Uncharacterized protein n=1 Tax=Fundulus heteroclitus TaxID=8078 RepID=A0A3Q2NMT3_FUNHE